VSAVRISQTSTISNVKMFFFLYGDQWDRPVFFKGYRLLSTYITKMLSMYICFIVTVKK
jgi:hypothetical protein